YIGNSGGVNPYWRLLIVALIFRKITAAIIIKTTVVQDHPDFATRSIREGFLISVLTIFP
ncbi:MAG: hypothetical protein ACI9LY_003903, partial [Arenicella sp.]